MRSLNQGKGQKVDNKMVRKTLSLIISLLISSSAYSLDLEREYLLNMYHDVESEGISQDKKVNPAQSWTNISNGIQQNSQSDNQSEIKFSSLVEKKEPQTQLGIFSNKALVEEAKKQNRYGMAADSDFEVPVNESYGVYIKQRF